MNEKTRNLWRASLRGLGRLLTLRPCEFCGKRVECWRWHVEYLTCPTCKRDAGEFSPAFGHIGHGLLRRPDTAVRWMYTLNGVTYDQDDQVIPYNASAATTPGGPQ